MRAYRAYVFDLDGTLFRGQAVLPYAVEVVSELRSKGALIRFLTNNSARTRAYYVDLLGSMGFDPRPEDIYSTATGTAAYLNESSLSRAWVLGEQGLIRTLRQEGITVVNADEEDRALSDLRSPADAAVVGLCRDRLSYSLLDATMQQILGGAKFIATNRDASYPLEGGALCPGAGSIVAAVQTCTGMEPYVIGKPQPYLIELILSESGLSPDEVLVIGDRLDTDIECGRVAGCDTHLVLTGVTATAPAGQRFSEDLRALLF